MKNIALLTMVSLMWANLSATNINVAAPEKPTLVLEVEITNSAQISSVNYLQTDIEISNLFEIVSRKSTENVARIIHKESGVVLGMFYGMPSKDFLLEIYRTQLTPDYVNFVVPRLRRNRKI